MNNASLSPGDTVLLQGGAVFTDTLIPPSSGTSTSPITFGSYGTGNASISSAGGGVWIPAARHDLVFEKLDLSSSSSIVFAATGSGTGTYDITLRSSVVHDSPYSGLAMQPQDSAWTISQNIFRHLGDSGLLVQGNRATIDSNTITDTGWNTAITYGKHGIYAKAPNVTISNNDISFDTNGSGVSLRYGGARVFGNAIHDTLYAVSLFPQDPTNQGIDYFFNNRLWNITGFAFYYAGYNSVVGAPSGIDVVWTSNTARLAGASEAVNVSEVTSAQVTIANSVFFGSYGSAYRGCATCSEHHNDWYGGTSNLPAGSGDKSVAPALSAAPALAPSGTSPVVDTGTTSVSYASYVATCDGHPMAYCLARPDQGAVEYSGSSNTTTDTTAPTTPAGLTFGSATQTGGTLNWSGSTDNVGVAGYDVSVDGARVATQATTGYSVSGLTCGTTHTFGVVAFDAAGNRSGASTATGVTAACATPPPPPPPPPAATVPTVSFSNASDGSIVSRSYTFSVSAGDPTGISSLGLAVDGETVCTVSTASLDCTASQKGGWHTITATAVSGAGASGSASIRVRFAH